MVATVATTAEEAVVALSEESSFAFACLLSSFASASIACAALGLKLDTRKENAKETAQTETVLIQTEVRQSHLWNQSSSNRMTPLLLQPSNKLRWSPCK